MKRLTSLKENIAYFDAQTKTKLMRKLFSLLFIVAALTSCSKKSTTTEAHVNFIFKFDSTQVRLNNVGSPSGVIAGHKAQSPKFNFMSAHYVELDLNQFAAIGSGAVLYRAAETTAGGTNAIDFSKATLATEGQTFLSVPVSSITPGTYNWLRVSLAYQNYKVNVTAGGNTFSATVASFIGFRSYIQSYKVKDSTVTVNGNRDQGYWAFEASTSGVGVLRSGQAPAGATTVPNPIFASSPIPAGSCLVTGQFGIPLVITGKETGDITIVVSLSTNKSFEWIDSDGNNTFDPLNGDAVADMGIRGLIPIRQ